MPSSVICGLEGEVYGFVSPMEAFGDVSSSSNSSGAAGFADGRRRMISEDLSHRRHRQVLPEQNGNRTWCSAKHGYGSTVSDSCGTDLLRCRKKRKRSRGVSFSSFWMEEDRNRICASVWRALLHGVRVLLRRHPPSSPPLSTV